MSNGNMPGHLVACAGNEVFTTEVDCHCSIEFRLVDDSDHCDIIVIGHTAVHVLSVVFVCLRLHVRVHFKPFKI